MNIDFIKKRKQILEPVKGSSWASEMTLNPTIIQDQNANRIHMLFRATGPWEQKRLDGKPLPYPICLGYGYSEDNGENWVFDLDRPALQPKIEYDMDQIYIKNINGEVVVNHANGCIEDPRFFYFEEECYITTACRMFPPGPYWEHDDPIQCAPEWVRGEDNPFGKAASENYTVNVLFKVDLEKLTLRDYENAFQYVTNLTDAQFGEDRDVFFFPRRLEINGEKKIVMLQRPYIPANYPFFTQPKPSIVIAVADAFEEFKEPKLKREILAVPEFIWEDNRIGASVPPIEISEGQWLLNYHGKQDEVVGYTQSFMILEETKVGVPKIVNRLNERVIIAQEDFEMPNKFKTPCVFITGMIKIGNELLVSYGAADERVGIMKLDYVGLVKYLNTRQ